jgi:DHA1 family bicyclomycin/chloramphenicol resistance-like MFS transporter
MGIVKEIRERFPPIILLLALLSAFPPLATDMYLPALPLLQREWQVPLVVINLTLVTFFITYCGFLLIYGPLSDRYGRKPPLLVGVGLFVLSCLVCGLAQSPSMMICGRILQGAGAAAASAIVFAVSKDRFTGQQRQRVFIQIGVIVATAPMIAPILGGWIIALFSWRWIFLLQAIMGTLAFVGVLRMDESLRPQAPPSFSEVASGYLRLFRNKRYMVLLLTLSCTCVPVFAFIGGSADLYITRLGFDERQFGYFFGFNALAFVLAPLSFSRMVRHFPITRLMPYAFTGMLVSSLLLLCPWIPDPWRLTLPMFCLTFSFSFCRPAGNNLILEQVDRDTGAASSLMVFFYFMIGALAMWFFSFDWNDKIVMLGRMGVVSVTCTLLLWQVCMRIGLVYPGLSRHKSN